MNKAILENLNEKGVLTLTLNRPDVLNAMKESVINFAENVMHARK